MPVTPELRAQILRYYHVEQWRVGTIARLVSGKYQSWLDAAIDDCLDADLVLVQLGVDPHLLDPLGGLLSTQQMAERDRAVFTRLGNLPLCWTLAGGYQVGEGSTPAERLEPVLRLHRQTARIATEVIAGSFAERG